MVPFGFVYVQVMEKAFPVDHELLLIQQDVDDLHVLTEQLLVKFLVADVHGLQVLRLETLDTGVEEVQHVVFNLLEVIIELLRHVLM